MDAVGDLARKYPVLPLDAKEVYLGLQTGVIDGQENPPSNIYNAKLYEVQKYVMLTGHILQNNAVAVGEKFYQSLSPAFQKALQEAAIEAGNFQNDLVLSQEMVDLDRLKVKGMTIIHPDVKAFREATKDVNKKYADKWEPHFYCAVHDLSDSPPPNRTVRGRVRGGVAAPPLSVGPAGRAERLLAPMQARGPSLRTKRSGRICSLTSGPISTSGSRR